MASEPRSFVPSEPGHRYMPRQVKSRFINDVRGPVATVRATQTPPKPRPATPSIPKVREVSALKPALPRQKRSLVLKRQIVKGAALVQKQQRQQRRRQVSAFALGGVIASIVTFVVLGGFLFNQAQTDKSHSDAATLGVSDTTGNGRLDEKQPTNTEISAYTTAPEQPKFLRVPKLQLQAMIKQVGEGLRGEPLTPSNVFDVGWFDQSAKPGEQGVMLVIGQVVGPTKPGVFSSITSLAVGDVVEVERGDGKVFSFVVAKSQQFSADRVNMQEAKEPAIAGKPGLNLLTSGGRYNVRTNQFEHRTLIFAIQQ